MKEMIVHEIADWKQIAKVLLQDKAPPVLIALLGDLGSGKTTLVQYICQELGLPEQVLSPTYSLINEYTLPNGQRIAHIDLYRLQDIEEALQIGISSYLEDYEYCFIEWPQLIESLLPAHSLIVRIETLTNNERKVVVLGIANAEELILEN